LHQEDCIINRLSGTLTDPYGRYEDNIIKRLSLVHSPYLPNRIANLCFWMHIISFDMQKKPLYRDIKKRIEMGKENAMNNREIDRHKKGCENFGEKYFCDQNGKIIKTKLPFIFTPSTVKLLQYYFALHKTGSDSWF
jgi:hypothetical protein